MREAVIRLLSRHTHLVDPTVLVAFSNTIRALVVSPVPAEDNADG